MTASRRVGFISGLLLGVLVGSVLFVPLLLTLSGQQLHDFRVGAGAYLAGLWQFTALNLRGSVLLFTVVLIVYWRQLHILGNLLDKDEPVMSEVVRCEQALDMCATLFFGIGVIWTAIGMREALLSALGGGEIAANRSAFLVLQNLVDGGILLALSTTIVGGVGGYLMRALKSVMHGGRLTELYIRTSQLPAEENLAALRRIERKLATTSTSHELPRDER